MRADNVRAGTHARTYWTPCHLPAHMRAKNKRAAFGNCPCQIAYARRQCARSDTRTCAHILDALPFLRTCAQKTSAQHLETVPTSICAPTVCAQRHAHMRAHTGRAAIPAHMRAKNTRAAKVHNPSPWSFTNIDQLMVPNLPGNQNPLYRIPNLETLEARQN